MSRMNFQRILASGRNEFILMIFSKLNWPLSSIWRVRAKDMMSNSDSFVRTATTCGFAPREKSFLLTKKGTRHDLLELILTFPSGCMRRWNYIGQMDNCKPIWLKSRNFKLPCVNRLFGIHSQGYLTAVTWMRRSNRSLPELLAMGERLV